jgi:hypothetical protein
VLRLVLPLSSLAMDCRRFKFTMLLLVPLLCSSVTAQKPAPAKDDHASDWKEFSSAKGQFTVSLPGTPKEDISTVGTPLGLLKSHYFVVETDKFLYYVAYVDLPAGPETPEETKEALDASRDHALANHRLISENDVTVDGIVARELLVDRNGLIMRGRFFYSKERLYHVILTGSTNVVFRDGKPSANAKDRTDLFEKTAAKFFDSFKITK